MINETMVTVVGNIASDVTSRRVGTEPQTVVNFRVASSERRWDRATEAWVDGNRFSAHVSCWRRLGEGVQRSLAKGDPVVVHGRLSVREYEINGERRYSTEIEANSVGPDLTRSSAHVIRRGAGTDDAATVRAVPASDDTVGDALVGAASASGFAAASVGASTPGPDTERADDGDDEAAPLAASA